VFAEKKHILCKSAAAFLQTLSSYLPYFQQEAWEINDKLIDQN
jgi:peroxiredoxin